MIGVGREMHAAEPGALEASQGEVEFELGFEGEASSRAGLVPRRGGVKGSGRKKS